MYKILDTINSPEDVKKLNKNDLIRLSVEVRDFLINAVSKTGGHLSSNLGVVELTIALHHVFNSPEDKIIWDVSHQSYVHKLLTGRKSRFDTLRQFEGLSGFTKRDESNHDIFDAGHSSTSISAALGVAISNKLLGKEGKAIAVIGDGALTGGMALEALNHAGHAKNNLLVILNDNEMSISENVGGISSHLTRMRTRNSYLSLKKSVIERLDNSSLGKDIIKGLDKARMGLKQILLPNMLFEEMGLKYIGPIDGHNIELLIDTLSYVKDIDGPVLVHVITKKGKGYNKAETAPHDYHGVGSFDIGNGITPSDGGYSGVFGKKLLEMASKHNNIVALTAAMDSGTGLTEFRQKYPDRFFDVGIAEQHAVTLSASLSLGGLKPYFAVYSTFLQRAFDQVIHDVAIQNCDVVLCIDRSGLVGQDGETHQGLYDISYLSLIPGVTILTPKDSFELERCLEYSYTHKGPLAIRYPRGKAYQINQDQSNIFKPEIVREGTKNVVIAYGRLVKLINDELEKLGDTTTKLINGRINKPLPVDSILDMIEGFERVFIAEETTYFGSTPQTLTFELSKRGFDTRKINSITLPDEFIKQGSIEQLLDKYGLTGEKIIRQVLIGAEHNE